MASEINTDAVRVKVDALNSEAWQIRVADSSLAFTLSREALELARQIGYAKGLAESLRTYGFCLIRLSRHQEAMPLLEEAFALFDALGSELGKSEVYEYFGIIHRSLGNFDASLENLYKALDISLHGGYKEEASLAYYHLGVTHKYLGNYEKALEYLLESLRTAREISHSVAESYALNLIGQVYFETGDYNQALNYYQQSLQMRKQSGDLWGEAGCLDNIGYSFYKLGSLDEAVHHCTESLNICLRTGDRKGQANTLFHLSELFCRKGEMQKAIEAANESLQIRKEINDNKGQAEVLLFLAELSPPSAKGETMKWLAHALVIGNEIKAKDLLAKTHLQFYKAYKDLGRFENALESLEAYNGVEKEMHRDALAGKVINLQITHRVEQAKKEAENYRIRNAELSALYEELKKQKEETDIQKQKAEQTLEELRSAQAQLIQREKMASLGELTAGIAHEIQNPLNFVNNFSDINKELIAEMKEEIDKGDIEEVKAIASDIEENEIKINHHGKRADAIVKGMMQHSRTSAGKKEPTDINTLADEYLRLAYHGLRAKDKDFNADFKTDFKTDFDKSIGKIEVVPQDIGRVLLNLYNNAFYAASLPSEGGFKKAEIPTVWVTTKRTSSPSGAGGLEISVRDNGPGIPSNIVDKIFQPFFTTKPTGQGTGLGLSLSYDIVKAHGGELRVETKEGDGTKLIIQLPII